MGKVWQMPSLPKPVKPPPPKVEWVSGGMGSEVQVMIQGAQGAFDFLMSLGQAAKDAAGVEMSLIAHEVIVDSQENYVPVADGDLRSSGDSDKYVEGDPASLIGIRAWFGAPLEAGAAEAGVVDTEEYAWEQHENLLYHHPPADQGGVVGGLGPGSGTGGPKYLELPWDKMKPTVLSRVAARVKAVVGGETGAPIAAGGEAFQSVHTALHTYARTYPKYGRRPGRNRKGL